MMHSHLNESIPALTGNRDSFAKCYILDGIAWRAATGRVMGGRQTSCLGHGLSARLHSTLTRTQKMNPGIGWKLASDSQTLRNDPV